MIVHANEIVKELPRVAREIIKVGTNCSAIIELLVFECLVVCAAAAVAFSLEVSLVDLHVIPRSMKERQSSWSDFFHRIVELEQEEV